VDKKLLVLVHLLVKDALAEIKLPEGPQGLQGKRGQKGLDGNDFNLEDHKEAILSYVKENYKLELSEEILESLKGKDGKSVSFLDVIPTLEESLHARIEEIRPSLKLKFSDLTPEEVEFLKGKDGREGKKGDAGKDFSFEENKESLENLIISHVDSIRENLKLKISDLSESEISDLRGAPGPSGKNGKDFSFEENRDAIKELVNSYVESIKGFLKLKISDLSESERSELRGDIGPSGKNGKDFSFEDSKKEIEELLDSVILSRRDLFKLKFSDLTPEEVLSLKGEKGSDGKDGFSFLFEEHEEAITNKIVSHILDIKDSLKLKKEDMEESDWENIRGQTGRAGKDGINFDFDLEKENIKNVLIENRKNFILSLSELTEQEFNSLKFKFEDFTPEEIEILKGKDGARGQKGRRGLKGDPGEIGNNGKDGATWHSGEGLPEITAKDGDFYFDVKFSDIYFYSGDKWNYISNIRGMMGPIGPTGGKGRDGINGLDGYNGKDAPVMTGVEVLEDPWDKNYYYFVFTFSDSSTLKSNSFKLPAALQNIYYSGGGISGGGGGGKGKLEILDEDESLGETNKLKFIGNGVDIYKDGDIIVVNIPGQDQNTTDLIVQKDGEEIVVTNTLDFIGDGVSVTHENGKAIVEVLSIPGSGDLNIQDEGVEVAQNVKNLNFIGPNVVARLRVPISEWNTLSEVEPSIGRYLGNNPGDTVDVYIELPDSSLLQNIDCLPDVEVGNFVIIDEWDIARNAMANSYLTSNVIGLVESKSANTKCHIRVGGLSKSIYQNLNPELDYYLSDVDAGKISATVPTTSGHIKLKLGQSFGTRRFLFQKGERVVRA
jgi:hypothetical protein